MPVHPHEVSNTGDKDMEMLVVAVAHDCPDESEANTKKYTKKA